MPYKYQVQSFAITGEVIKSVFSNSEVASIIVHVYEDEKSGRSDVLKVDVYAANKDDEWLDNVRVKWGSLRMVPLRNEFIERKMFITRSMIEEVSKTQEHGQQIKLIIKYLDLTPKRFRYTGSEHPGDQNKDFVAYRVFIKRKRK